MAALVVRGDKTALEELCNSVRDKTDAVSGEEGICYTAESWAAFADARTAANAVLEDENADERQVLNAREERGPSAGPGGADPGPHRGDRRGAGSPWRGNGEGPR